MNASLDAAEVDSPAELNRPWRAAFAGFVGTSLEWYDYFLYGSVAALVFPGCSSPSWGRRPACSSRWPRSASRSCCARSAG